MSTAKRVVVVGGGLAGLTLGIGLRQRGVPVTIWESGQYPRHRVCGEFISGRGLAVLRRLKLIDDFSRAGAIEARTACFFYDRIGSVPWRLPVPALCLSRFTLDELLARRFCEAGGELRVNQRWQQGYGEGVVRASGRVAQATEGGWRWFGLKAHVRGVPLEADLEMHGAQDSYVGLCRLPGGEVNVCGLFRRWAEDSPPKAAPEELLRGSRQTILRQRMSKATFDPDSFCSVAGLALRPRFAQARPECSVGDALTMVPPVTGNGMSMAFEAAEQAIDKLSAYSRRELSWDQARHGIARSCDEMFSGRLAWARVLQWSMFTPLLHGPLGAAVLRSQWLWGVLFFKTR